MNTLDRNRFVKHALCTAVALACACAVPAQAVPVTSITLTDIGSRENPDNADDTDGNYDSAIDGLSQAFRFANINETYTGASLFYGDVAAAPGAGLGEIDVTQANTYDTFTTGFLFAGIPFRPITQGPIDIDISVIGGVMTMVINDLPFAGVYGANPATGQIFVLPPDSSKASVCGPPDEAGDPFVPITVFWLRQLNPTQVAFKIGWSHCITTAEDPSGSFWGFNAHWRLEGIAQTAVSPGIATSYNLGQQTPVSPPPPEFSPSRLSGGCTLNPNAKFDLAMTSLLLASAGGLALGRHRRKKQKQ